MKCRPDTGVEMRDSAEWNLFKTNFKAFVIPVHTGIQMPPKLISCDPAY